MGSTDDVISALGLMCEEFVVASDLIREARMDLARNKLELERHEAERDSIIGEIKVLIDRHLTDADRA